MLKNFDIHPVYCAFDRLRLNFSRDQRSCELAKVQIGFAGLQQPNIGRSSFRALDVASIWPR